MPSVRQHVTFNTSGIDTNVAFISVSPTVLGDLIVVGVGNADGLTATSVTDSEGNTYTQASGAAATNGFIHTDVWYCLRDEFGGVTQIVAHFNFSSIELRTLWVATVNVAGQWYFDIATSGTGSVASGLDTGPALSTTSDDGFLLCVNFASNVTGIAGGNEFTHFLGNGGGDGDAYLLSHSAASHQPIFDDAGLSGDPWAMSVAAFKYVPTPTYKPMAWQQRLG